MIALNFAKMEAIGNHFPLFRLDELAPLATPERSLDWLCAKLAVVAADPRFGIGGDGILLVAKEEADLRLRMFNPDGTEDFCGNGLRCAARFAADHLGFAGDFNQRHLDRIVPTRVEPEGWISTTLGIADYTPERVPLIDTPIFNEIVWSGMDSGMPLSLFGSALTTGSTHVVIPTAEIPEDDTFRSVSAKIENDPRFPQRTSVIWSREIAPMKLQIRIWERGVGETLGCGTGSSAAAADYLRRRSGGGTVTVVNPGGAIGVTMAAWDAPITILGKAREVYSGVFEFPI